MTRLAHLGVIVRRINEAASLYRRLGLQESGRETFAQENIQMAFFPIGDARVELMEPTGPTGPLDRFLATRGEGIHHLALEVPNIARAIADARRAGLRLIDESPRPGAHGTRVAFIHPSSAHGVLVELIERSPADLR
jgi:methylmalonyl-CoA/ethylmalonyl-CoA epimerase